MIRFARTWVLWLLMLVLPMQATAGAAQLSCEIGRQQHNSSIAKPGHASLKRQGSEHAADHAACTPCASCCAASGPGMPAPHGGAEQHRAFQPSLHAGVIPERLERPPRLHPS